METQYLRYFVTVAEELSFSRAARKCAVSQPSLSAQVRKMESLLGCSLFHRTKRSVQLTPEGSALYPRARRILLEMEDLGIAAKELSDPYSGRLAVGVTPLISQSQVFPKLLKLRKKYPKLSYEFFERSTSDLVGGLRDGKYSVAFLPWSEELRCPGLEVVKVDSDSLVYCLPKEARSDFLKNRPFIATPAGCGLRAFMKEASKKLSFDMETPFNAHHVDMIKHWVKLGLGWSVMPSRCLNSEDKRTLQVRPCRPNISLSYVGVFPKGSNRSSLLRELA